MKYNLEQQMDIGRQMYLHEITYKEAMARYDISESCAHKYMTDYKKANGIPSSNQAAGKIRPSCYNHHLLPLIWKHTWQCQRKN